MAANSVLSWLLCPLGSYSTVSLVGGLFASVSAFISFFVVPFIGSRSDRIGRQPCMLLLNCLVNLCTWVLALHVNLWIYWVATLVSRCSSYGINSAYITGTNTPCCLCCISS